MNNFSKKDLRTGDIVVGRNGDRTILLGNRFKEHDDLSNAGGWGNIREFNDNITHENLEEFDIVKVYRLIDCYDFTLAEIVKNLPLDKVEKIWERKREIDWTKVPKFTRVQVRDNEENKWKNYYFEGVRVRESEDKPFRYTATICDEFTRNGHTYPTSNWNQIKIYDESQIKEEWYK